MFDAAKKEAVVGCEAFLSLELGFRKAPRAIHGGGYKDPLATHEDGLAGLFPKLSETLKGAATEVDSLEAECRSLFITVATRVFSHLYLEDPSFNLNALIHSVDPESSATAAAGMKAHVDASLKSFLCVPDPEALVVEVRNVRGGDDEGGSDIDDGLPEARASGSNGQGSGGASS